MSKAAISVEGLGKKYTVGYQKQSDFRNAFGAKLKSLITRYQGEQEEFWAVKDVSFQINQGEAVGIIGRNGAGKSTLLKILSRITEPSTGRFEINGRVSSLLEVGTGFHAELTGRENIYLNGTILGMKKTEIKSKFNEIVEFSGVEKFIDTPVKHYSSGMKVRLAFSVAAHLEPEILIVDEVLAVGDAEFQKKCLGKMDEVSKNDGRTVIFVSHDMQSVSTLTSKSILLNNGSNIFTGGTTETIARYLGLKNSENSVYLNKNNDKDSPVYIESVKVVTSESHNTHIYAKPCRIEFDIMTKKSIKGACLSFQILNEFDTPILHLWVFDSEKSFCRNPGKHRLACNIPKLRLYMGSYTLKVYLSEPPGGEMFEVLDHICPFEVKMYTIKREYPFVSNTCTYIDDFDWDISQI
ncbi:MAG: ABC transporter ATP-binding protein [Bacteroidota bacterium]